MNLTKREAEVERLLLKGRSLKEAAFELGIAENTADHHRRHLYRKRGVSNRMGLAREAVKRGDVGLLEQ